MKHYFFLDETGDHGLSFIDRNFPLFLLCGCLIDEYNLLMIEEQINEFKKKYFKTVEVILHSREIRKCEGAFQILFNLDLKSEFYCDLNRIMTNSKYCLIGSGINKEEHIKKYGLGAKDPYSLSLSFILERLVFYLDKINEYDYVEIIVEERAKREDNSLIAHFNSIMDLGTYFVKPDRLKAKIKKFSFRNKKGNIIGLQLADLCAYPLARHLLNPDVPYIPFKIIENKLYCNKGGKYEGWGLKIFP